MLDFDRVQASLEALGASCDAAESQGTLCGLLIDNAPLADWLSHSLEDLPDQGDVLAAEHLGVLKSLYELTRDQLCDDELSLELLLPDESDDFGVRLLGLSSWCQGLLYGIGVAGKLVEDRLDEATQECLSDLLEISKLSHDAEPGDEAEQQFFEIVEHARMATLMLHDTLNPLRAAPGLH